MNLTELAIGEWAHLAAWFAFSLNVLYALSFFSFFILFRSGILLYSQLFFILLSFLLLGACFYYDDFSLAYVANNSHSLLPWYYKITAIWGAHEGSLLLWVVLLSLFLTTFPYKSNLAPVIGCWINSGIMSLLLFTSNPFLRYLPNVPIEGADLNPLLQDFAFVLHPPFLYLGYVGFIIPFIITIATLFEHKQFNLKQYVLEMRIGVLIPWCFLTIGILLGSWWAYYELGWGGWWFWDPVENASLMPWLTGAALLHALIVLSKKPNSLAWVMLLAIMSFGLSILGTFLVRSGILISVHNFAADPERGLFILFLLMAIIGGALILFYWKMKNFNLPSVQIGFFNSQGLTIAASVILFCLMISIFLGTLYPLLVDIIFHEKISIGLPYFNKVTVPFFLSLIIGATLGPNFPLSKKRLILISLVSLLITISIIILNDYQFSFGFLTGLFLIINLFLNSLYNCYVKPYRIGMNVAHIGFAVLALGAMVNTTQLLEKEIVLSVGEKIKIDKYIFYFADITSIKAQNYEAKEGRFIITLPNQKTKQLLSQKRYYPTRQMALSETGIWASIKQDIYIALGQPVHASTQTWSIRIIIHPLVRWIWCGGLIIACGAFISAFKLIYNKRKVDRTHAKKYVCP